MFEKRKIKKVLTEFQERHNLTDREMTYIVVQKSIFNGEYICCLNPRMRNERLYKKLNELSNRMKEKLNAAKDNFFELAKKFDKEDIYNEVHSSCFEDMEDFLYLFQYNSEGCRVSFTKDAPADAMSSMWDKADAYLNTLCWYFLLRLNKELGMYTQAAICELLKVILKSNKDLESKTYEDIQALVVKKATTIGNSLHSWGGSWNEASILSIE